MVPSLNFRGLPPSVQGTTGLGVPPPEDAGVAQLPLRAGGPPQPAAPARVEGLQVRVSAMGTRHWSSPRLDFRGVPLSLHGNSGLGAPPPEDTVAPAMLLAPEQQTSKAVSSAARASAGSECTKSTAREAAQAPGPEADGGPLQPAVVPRLNLQGLPPSLQGSFGLGMPPPEEAAAVLLVADHFALEESSCSGCSGSRGPPGIEDASTGVAALPASRGALRATHAAAWAVPRLNLWGLPPSLQGCLGFGVRPSANAVTLQPWAAQTGHDEDGRSSRSTTSVELNDAGAEHDVQASAAAAAQPSPVPRLNLHGLPPPRSYEIWAVAARFWWADNQQRTSSIPSHHAAQLTTVVWTPGVGDPRCAVCLSDFEVQSSVSRLPCGHLYHEDCIERWTSTQPHCPLCRCPC